MEYVCSILTIDLLTMTQDAIFGTLKNQHANNVLQDLLRMLMEFVFQLLTNAEPITKLESVMDVTEDMIWLTVLVPSVHQMTKLILLLDVIFGTGIKRYVINVQPTLLKMLMESVLKLIQSVPLMTLMEFVHLAIRDGLLLMEPAQLHQIQ